MGTPALSRLFSFAFAIVAVPAALGAAGTAQPRAGASFEPGSYLTSGSSRLIVTGKGLHLVLIGVNGALREFACAPPLTLQLLDNAGETAWLSGNYGTIERDGEALRCIGEIHTPSGSIFEFRDTYRPGQVANSFELARQVDVRSPAASDTGFLTRFGLQAVVPSPTREHDCFVPGIWYKDNHYVPPRALAANPSEERILIREDRMPLPLIMMRSSRDRTSITLIHADPDGSTCLADFGADRVVDGRLQVASLGVYSPENPLIAFCCPGSEGDRSYIWGASQEPGQQWVARFHPVQVGVKHSYTLLFMLSEDPDFAGAMRRAWRTAFDRIHPPVVKTDLAAAYEASIQLLADCWQNPNGCPGFPFRLKLPKGNLEGDEFINYQMGFIGQQLPLAYHLLRYGLLNHNEGIRHKGEAIVDFWAAHSLTNAGIPRTWFDPLPQPHWRPYNTFLRVASDGMGGVLAAWNVMKCHGQDRPNWLQFCRAYGDWLIAHQNSDGSWYREVDFDGNPVQQSKLNTTHPISFLVDLSLATGNRDYLAAAIRAGNFCWTHIHEAFAYVGGTPDNPNVMDKEAGVLAMNAFLALHDATRDQRWIDAAAQAADFTETWQYTWNIPMPAKGAGLLAGLVQGSFYAPCARIQKKEVNAGIAS